MDGLSVSDLSRNFNLRALNRDLNSSLVQFSAEIVSGRTSDTTLHLDGHLSFLTQIETDLIRNETRVQTLAEVAFFAEAQQSSLDRISGSADILFETLAVVSNRGNALSSRNLAIQAQGGLDTIISALNANQGGRHVFSGANVDQTALASSNQLLTELSTAMSGAANFEDAMDLADDFFHQPTGGFETAIYLGSKQDLAPINLGNGETVKVDLRADQPDFRDLLKAVALVALVDDDGLSLSEDARHDLALAQIDPMLDAKNNITGLQGELGFTEERIDRTAARLGSERTGLELARSDLIDVDPYETASALEAVRQQLETLYTITARTSNLSLVNFLS